MLPWDDRWANAISGIESSGRYDLQGPVTKSGDRAWGKYQVMGANIPEWTKSALGRALTPQEFLSDPEAQDAVFKNQFGSYVQKYGSPEEAASVWFSGRPMAQAGNAKDILGTTVPAYVSKFNRFMGEPGVQAINSATQPKGDAMTPTPAPNDGFMGALLNRIGGQGNGSGGTYDLGDAMANAGASMMALDNAKGAAVMAAMQQANKKQHTSQKMTEWGYEPSTGVFYRTNPMTGQLETKQGSAKEKPVPEGALKSVGETMSNYDYLTQSAQQATDILDDLNSGRLNLGLLNNWVNSGKNLAGLSDEQSRALARYSQFQQSLVNDNLRLNKGVQTEGDAYRELKSIQANGTQYDNETAKQALRRVVEKAREAVLSRGTAALDSHVANYGGAAFEPYSNMAGGWKNAFGDIDKRLGSFPKPGAASAKSSDAPSGQWKVIGVRRPNQ